MDKKLNKYRKQIMIESIIKSVIFGLLICFSAIFVFSFIFFICRTKQVLITIVLSGILGIISGFVVFYQKYKPNVKSVAKRVDELGLEERVITMVEFNDKGEYIYQKQREDTNEILDSIKETALKPKFSKSLLIMLGVAMVLGLCSFALPKLSNNDDSTPSIVLPPASSSISTSIKEEEPILDEDEIIRQLIEKLRELIDKAAVGQDFKDELHTIVDKLELDIKSLTTLEEKIEAISNAREEIKKLIDEELLRLSIGRCLKQNEITYELGNVILIASGDENKIPQVETALNNLKTKLMNSENFEEDLEELIESLTYAIETATKEKNTALVEALIAFRDALLGNASGKYKTYLLRKQASKDEIEEIFTKANEEIQESLKKILEDMNPEQGESEDDVEDLGESLDQAIQDAQDQLQDMLDDANSDSGSKDDGEVGTTPPPTFDDADLESDTVIDGKTQYLTVFDEYYEEITKYLSENEDVPDEIRQIIEQYLEMIKGAKGE